MVIYMDIKSLRLKTGLSQSKFARMYNLSLRQVQCWECGYRNTPEAILYLLGRLVEIDFPEETVLDDKE